MNDQRKQELIAEFISDMQHYLDSVDIIENFIDCTCRTQEEAEFMDNIEWGITVYE